MSRKAAWPPQAFLIARFSFCLGFSSSASQNKAALTCRQPHTQNKRCKRVNEGLVTRQSNGTTAEGEQINDWEGVVNMLAPAPFGCNALHAALIVDAPRQFATPRIVFETILQSQPQLRIRQAVDSAQSQAVQL